MARQALSTEPAPCGHREFAERQSSGVQHYKHDIFILRSLRVVTGTHAIFKGADKTGYIFDKGLTHPLAFVTKVNGDIKKA